MRKVFPALLLTAVIVAFVFFLLSPSGIVTKSGPTGLSPPTVPKDEGRPGFSANRSTPQGSPSQKKRGPSGENFLGGVWEKSKGGFLDKNIKGNRHPGSGVGPKLGKSSRSGSSGGKALSSEPLSGKGTGTIIASIIDEEGAAVPGVAVLLEGKNGREQAFSDEQGYVAFRSLPSDQYRISVKAEESSLRACSLIFLEEKEIKRITLRISSPDSYIKGRCLDSKGNPLSGVQLEARPADEGGILNLWPHSGSTLKTESDSEGFYEITSLPKGTYRVVASWSVTGEKVPRTVSAPASGVDFVFKAPFEVKIVGICTDPEGVPVQGAVVSVIGRSPVTTRTDKSGEYSLVTKTLSWWGTLYLRAWKEGYRRCEESLSLKGEEGGGSFRVDFVLRPIEGSGEIQGILINEEGEPVAGEVVYLSSPTARINKSARSSQEGFFSFKGLEPAKDYTLAVFPRKTYKDLRKRGIEVLEGETVRVELVLEFAQLGSIEGIALDAEGRPLGGFLFRVRSTQSWSQDIKVVTAPDGTFAVEEVPAGEIMFDTRASPHYSIRGLRLRSGERKQVRLVFGVGDLRVEGVVRSSEGRPVAGVRVSLAWVRTEGELTSSVLRTTVTDNRGWYRMTGLAPGKYVVTADVVGSPSHRSTRELNENARWDITLPAR